LALYSRGAARSLAMYIKGMTTRHATSAPFVLVAFLLCPVAGIFSTNNQGIAAAGGQSRGCPRLKGVSMDKVILSHVEFYAELDLAWSGDASAPGSLSFTVSISGPVEGAREVLMSTAARPAVPLRITESSSEVSLAFTVRDLSGHCNATSAAFSQYVYPQHIPLAPLLTVLVVAPLTREVYFSLGLGGLVGTLILERYNVWLAFLRYYDTALAATIAGSFSKIILFMWLLGGVSGAAARSGGVKGVGETATKLIKDSLLGQFVVYLMGCAIFVDEYASMMIVGTALRPMTDIVRVSREKLAFIIDCTASPIAGVMPISTWIAHQITQIDVGIKEAGYTKDSASALFLMSIPTRFYSWFMLIFVLFNILCGRDWACMYWAEKRAREASQLCTDGTGRASTEQVDDAFMQHPLDAPKSFCTKGYTFVQTSSHAEVVVKDGIPARWWNAVIPFAGLVFMYVPLLFYSGAEQASGGVGWHRSARDILANADSWATLHWVGGFTMLLQTVLYACQYSSEWGGCLLTPRETIDAAMNGGIMYFKQGIALLLAFAYAQTVTDLQLSKWLIDWLGDTSEAFLPPFVFALCAAYSLATGTSWGTMTVFMPAVIPLAVHVGGMDDVSLLTTTISAVLGGAVWGDHCSPVSDTTILSAAASQVQVFDHVKTQLPYALFTGIMAMALGFAPCGGGWAAWKCLLLGGFLVPAIHVLLSFIPMFGGSVGIYNPRRDETEHGLCATMQSLKRFGGALCGCSCSCTFHCNCNTDEDNVSKPQLKQQQNQQQHEQQTQTQTYPEDLPIPQPELRPAEQEMQHDRESRDVGQELPPEKQLPDQHVEALYRCAEDNQEPRAEGGQQFGLACCVWLGWPLSKRLS